MGTADKASGLSWDRLMHLVDVYPETGHVIWNNPSGKRAKILAGTQAGYCDHKFVYAMICLDYKDYKRHRLVWFAVHKRWPSEDLDHIDGDRSNDSIFNLREASRAQNMWNIKNSKKNTSGHRCVFKDKTEGKWRVQILANGKYAFSARFNSKEEAIDAANSARERIHGQFARKE